MADFKLASDYPGDAAFGACYFTRAAKRKLVVETADGDAERDERVIITDAHIEYEGRIVVSEFAVRCMAHLLGMVDEWRIDRVRLDSETLRVELILASQRAATAEAEIRRLETLDRSEIRTVFIALDGTQHASARGALEASGAVADMEPSILADLIAVAQPKELVSP